MVSRCLSKNTKIIFLCAEPADYLFQCIHYLGSIANVIVIHQPTSSDAPFDLTSYTNISLCSTKDFLTSKSIIGLIGDSPDIIVTAGWSFKEYLKVSYYYRKRGTMTIMMSDTPWKGKFKQYILAALSPVLRYIFPYIWVAGKNQEAYAKILGYNQDRILHHLYSASPAFINSTNNLMRFNKKVKTLLFAGRLLSYKGIDLICAAYNSVYPKYGHLWNLKVVGNGPMKEELVKKYKNITFISFMQPDELQMCMLDSEGFILASDNENWGVTVHEAAASGLPLLLTEGVGAASVFLEDTTTGFKINSRTTDGIAVAMERLFLLEEKELKEMSKKSKAFSQKITQQIWLQQLESKL